MGAPALTEKLSDAVFQRLLRLTHEFTGITISPHRKSMVEGRLQKRILTLGVSEYVAYADLVVADAVERAVFVDLMTTNETYFFRTPRVWSYIETQFLPAWRAKTPHATFRAWSAASSSGEEAHSLGIACQLQREVLPGFDFSIVGTDISDRMIARAQSGLYRGRAIAGFRAARAADFAKYMRSEAEEFRVIDAIRSRISFVKHNLFSSLQTPAKFDLILLRNVLIYFTREDQERVVQLAEEKLAGGGRLIIGESESLTHIKSEFQAIEPFVYARASEGGAK